MEKINETKNFEEIEIGHIYRRRDGQRAIVFYFNSIQCLYNCVLVGSMDFFTVHEDGRYLESREDHNDLVYKIF